MEQWKDGFSKDYEGYEKMVNSYKEMIETGIPATDWGIVEKDEKTYYIMYVL